MTNSEVIKKISKHAGMFETDAQLFFEVFTQKLLEEFKPGDYVKVNNIGFLHLKNITIADEEKPIKGVVFSESKEVSKNNNIFFFSNSSGTFYPDDFCFSISLRKMEIPLGDEIDKTVFVPPAGNELLSFMDSKVDNLLNESEIFKSSSKEDENFIIRTSTPGMKVVEDLEDISDFKPLSDQKEIDPEKFQKLDSLYSNFSEEPDEDKPAFKNRNLIEEENDFNIDIDEKEDQDIRYKRVQSLTKKKEEKAAEKLRENKEEKNNIIESESTSEKRADNINADKTVEELPKEKVKPVESKPIVHEEKPIKRSRKKVFIPMIFIIILIGAAAYYYFNIYSAGTKNLAVVTKIPKSNPVVIEDDNRIPVSSAPESNSEENLIYGGINHAVFSNETKADETPAVNNSENEIPTVQQGIYKEYGDYIFSNGKTFFIQVSSWKSKNRAIAHAKELKEKGFESSIERVISPKGNVYYRVKLGNFNSLDEARDFIRNN